MLGSEAVSKPPKTRTLWRESLEHGRQQTAGSNRRTTLATVHAQLDLSRVREHLARITSRGYAREQDLEAKLAMVLNDVGPSKR